MANVASILSVWKWTFVRSHLSHRVRTNFIEGKLSPSLPLLDSWYFVKVLLSLGFFFNRLDLRFLVIFADAISLVYWQNDKLSWWKLSTDYWVVRRVHTYCLSLNCKQDWNFQSNARSILKDPFDYGWVSCKIKEFQEVLKMNVLID